MFIDENDAVDNDDEFNDDEPCGLMFYCHIAISVSKNDVKILIMKVWANE